MQIPILQAACIFLLLSQMTVIGAPDDSIDSEKLPVAINIERLEAGAIVLTIANRANVEQRLTTNLEAILSSLFIGFPTRAALQFRDAKGERSLFKGQNADGWRYPSLYSSSAEIGDLKKMSELTIEGGQVLSYPIECGKIFQLAMSDKLSEKDISLRQFRIRLPLDISVVSGKTLSKNIISDWFPIPEKINGSK